MSGIDRHDGGSRVTRRSLGRGMRPAAVAAMLLAALGAAASAQGPSPSGGTLSIVPGEELAPGTYRSSAVGDASFEIAEEGWVATYDEPDGGFGMVRADVPGTLDVARFEGDVFGPGCEPDGATIDATPDALVGYIANAAGVATATEPSPVSIGGLDGLAMDIATAEVAGCPGPSVAWIVPTLGRFFLLPGSATHIVALDAGDGVITIVADAPSADAEAFLAHARPVIDSMAFASAPEGSPTTAAGACAVSADREPAWEETFYVSGTGFQPGVDLLVRFREPTGTFEFGGEAGPNPSTLHTDADGAFGPWDITYTPDGEEPGERTLEFTDGSCVALLTFALPEP